LILLDGKKLSDIIQQDIKLEVDKLSRQNASVGLSVILVGDDVASKSYVKMKAKACERCGIKSTIHYLSKDISQNELLAIIDSLNKNDDIHGILVQLPLPKSINENIILNAVRYDKDVDGFSPFNTGSLLIGDDCFAPATPAGIIRLLEHYDIALESKNITIIGASNIVGKPLVSLFINANATVSVCNIHTKDVSEFTKNADIVCVGVGVANLLKADMIKDNAIIIDIGINKINGKIVGDVDFDNVSKKSSYITPVPGGVGPMTIAMLLENTIKAHKALTKGKN